MGDNSLGQCGLADGSSPSQFTQIPDVIAKDIACGDSHIVLVKADGRVYTAGQNDQVFKAGIC